MPVTTTCRNSLPEFTVLGNILNSKKWLIHSKLLELNMSLVERIWKTRLEVIHNSTHAPWKVLILIVTNGETPIVSMIFPEELQLTRSTLFITSSCSAASGYLGFFWNTMLARMPVVSVCIAMVLVVLLKKWDRINFLSECLCGVTRGSGTAVRMCHYLGGSSSVVLT